MLFNICPLILSYISKDTENITRTIKARLLTTLSLELSQRPFYSLLRLVFPSKLSFRVYITFGIARLIYCPLVRLSVRLLTSFAKKYFRVVFFRYLLTFLLLWLVYRGPARPIEGFWRRLAAFLSFRLTWLSFHLLV